MVKSNFFSNWPQTQYFAVTVQICSLLVELGVLWLTYKIGGKRIPTWQGFFEVKQYIFMRRVLGTLRSRVLGVIISPSNFLVICWRENRCQTDKVLVKPLGSWKAFPLQLQVHSSHFNFSSAVCRVLHRVAEDRLHSWKEWGFCGL